MVRTRAQRRAYVGRRNAASSYMYGLARRTGYGVLSSAGAYGTRRLMGYKPKKGRSRRGLRGRRGGRRSTRSTMKTKVRKLTEKVNNGLATHTYKSRASYQVNNTVAQTAYFDFALSGASKLETAMAKLRYFDPANPSVLTTAAGAAGGYSRTYNFKSRWAKMTVKNNNLTSAYVIVYEVSPKGDTSLVPSGSLSEISDQIINTTGAQVNSPQIYPTDSVNFNKMWRILKTTKRRIKPGGSMVVRAYLKPNLKYDPTTFDTHALEYQKKFDSRLWFVRTIGELAHGDTNDQVTDDIAELDIMIEYKKVIEYDAGTNLHDIYLDDYMPTAFTGVPVHTAKPAAEQQAFV